MDAPFHRGPSEEPRPVYGDYLEAPPAAHRPPPPGSERDPSALLHTASRLTASQGYDGPPSDHRHGFPAPSPGGGGRGFGGHGFPFPYGFDPSVPPPPFGCPPPGPFPSMAPPAPLNSYGSTGAFPPTFSSGSQTAQYDRDPRQRHLHHGSPFGHPPQVSMEDSVQTAPRAEDGATLQRKQDRQWLRGFLRSRDRPSGASRSRQQGCSLPELRAALAGAAQLVSRLRESCDTLRREADNEGVWMDSYLLALEVKRQLDDKLADLHGSHLDIGKEKLSRVAKRRARQRRAGRRRQVEDSWREERVAEKEAVIDKWRMEQIRQVQEKKTEQELKLAADAVLCEVRKKQADVKRMQDVLRSLEKLRRLRKDAASRKGITTEPEHEEAFSSRLEQLRSVMKRRTAVYSAEENALMVMLEGEQEEERKREQERRAKKERERLLQKKQKTEAMLFGGTASEPLHIGPPSGGRLVQIGVFVPQTSFLLILCCCPSENITPRRNTPCRLCSKSGETGTGLWWQRIILKVLRFLKTGSSQTSRRITSGLLLSLRMTQSDGHWTCCWTGWTDSLCSCGYQTQLFFFSCPVCFIFCNVWMKLKML